MFTTKYMKTQPKAAKPTKKFSKGGYVDPDVQSDEDAVDEQMASNRASSAMSDYVKDSSIRTRGPDRDGLYSPERAIDNISAQGRQRNYGPDLDKDVTTSVRRGKKS